MTFANSFDWKLPILFVNPPINDSPRLIEEVSQAGGLGIVDHVTAGRSGFQVSADVWYGVRIPVDEITSWNMDAKVKAILIPYDDAPKIGLMKPRAFQSAAAPVIVEVGSGEQAAAAQRAGASGLIARANEGPGWVSETSGLVLLQEILASSQLPVFLQGGVSFRTAAGAVASGAAGVVLDVHLLLSDNSSIDPSLKDFLASLSMPATTTLGDGLGRPLRVYTRVGTRMVRELRKIEDSVDPQDSSEYFRKLTETLRNPWSSPDSGNWLLPLSEDLIVAREGLSVNGSVSSILGEFLDCMNRSLGPWPLEEGSRICQLHGTRLPIVQGPMAHVSDNPDFLQAVSAAGALPFLALGNMPASIARKAIAKARERTDGKFGVGLIGLEVNKKCYEAHLEILKENPPPFAILAAGSADLAKLIEAQGTLCYVHCPTPGILSEGLKSGLRHFVFEGCESGGHIGNLGSLNLWSANLNVLESFAKQGLDLREVSVLFAGGIASRRGSAFVAGMASDLAAKGLNIAVQMGTAYLACREAVGTTAITPLYQKLLLKSNRTTVIGRTVNTRARAADSPMARQLIERETERLRASVALKDRKELYEKDNLGSLRLAAKGCSIDPSTAASECPVFCQVSPEEQLHKGLFLMGQAACLVDKDLSLEQLHSEIIDEGRRLCRTFGKFADDAQDQTLAPQERALPPAEVVQKEPIAVIGIGLRFPGSASHETFWEQIVSGGSGIGPIPEERWGSVAYYYHPDPRMPDKSYSQIGGFISNFAFDPLRYRIPPSVAKKMDRTQQLAVTCTAEALQDARLSTEQLKGQKVGIILGNSMGGENTDKYAERVGLSRAMACLEQAVSGISLKSMTRDALVEQFRSLFLSGLPDITEDSLPGELANVISGRVANVFNLEGPNFTVDAACASSLAALMNAVTALREGSIDCAITGGVDAAMGPASFVKFCKIGALSADGSRPFDAEANGFVMGEGAGILVLKRLSDAIRDGDRIYGTILEIGSSSDGKGKGITAPNAAGQERALRACYESAGIPVSSVGLIEAHGTSTPVGDQTELTVLDSFCRNAGTPAGSIGLGSVKSQIGHLKAAAGAAGVIKALLSLHHKTLPPTINIQRPTPCIEWDSSPLFLVTSQRKWTAPEGVLRRAGVSAFGFGGANFHVVLQEHSPNLRLIAGQRKAPARKVFSPPDWPTPPDMQLDGHVWVVGSKDPSDLSKKIRSLLETLTPSNCNRIASESRLEAVHCAIRCGFAATDPDSASRKLNLILEAMTDPSKRPFLPARGIHLVEASPENIPLGVALLFPGQGSQYPYMLRDLAQRFPIVAKTFQEADEVLSGLGLPLITSLIYPDPDTLKAKSDSDFDPIKDTQNLQPMILTANTALYRLLTAMGIQAVSVAGHSLGEYAACVAAGVFSFRDALEAVSVRGREMARVTIADPGLMMSIPADARLVEDVLAEVPGYVVAANKNSPKQTVISGETAAVRRAAELFMARGLEGTLIPVSAAFHSGVVAPAREPFMKTLQKLTINPPILPILSNVTGEFYPIGPSAPVRIRDLLGKQFAAPVEWVKSLRRLYSEGVRIFLECGPKRVLTNFALDTLPQDVVALPTNHPKKGGILQLLETVAALMAVGLRVDLESAEFLPETDPYSESYKRPRLTVVHDVESARLESDAQTKERPTELLKGLVDEEIQQIADQKEFARFLEFQGDSIRGLIKSGFKSFLEKVAPLEKVVQVIQSEGMDFGPVVVSGISAGLPSDVRSPFDRESLDELIMGRNFIKKVTHHGRRSMLEKNVERLYKGPSGEAELQVVRETSEVIQLAGFFPEDDFMNDYGLEDRLVAAMDVTTRLAVAAGIEALRDAGIPLMRLNRTTTTGHELPDSWALPPSLREETGIIFASAFPGMASLVNEVTRETAARYGAGAKKRLIDFYSGLVERIDDNTQRERVTRWFTDEFQRLSPDQSDELYTFNRSFLLKVMSMAHGQLAQLVKAQGPNTHVDAACAGTTQALLLARDWIRTGQAARVLVVAADDVAGETLLPWIGSGFLAMGAATTNGNLSEAALPFDDRRHGLILGSAAVGLVLEKPDLVSLRGMEPLVAIEAGVVANSGFHGTRLDVDHICSVMESLIGKWEKQSGLSRHDLAKNMFFMSHETYSPKRGGSASAEIRALRKTFGDSARFIPIANTKGFTGHTMGVGVEDVVAMRCLQKRTLPPIPNLKQPDPEFADMNLSRGGPCDATYAMRLAAGFGSQIVMTIFKAVCRDENRVWDIATHRSWLREITGYSDPVVDVDHRTLRVAQRSRQKTPKKDGLNAWPPQESSDDSGQGAVTPEISMEAVRATILALLSGKTGYPPDMLETGLDLEADLGIDTVKQAEFISEVRERFHMPRIEGLKIAEVPTIEHIIRLVWSYVGQGSNAIGAESRAEVSPNSSRAVNLTKPEIQEKILSLLSDKTGYPTDMLDLDFDLEADLGIDTVKQAEFISEIRESFNIPRIDGLKIADFPTIQHIVAFVMEEGRFSESLSESLPQESSSQPTAFKQENIRLFETRVIPIPEPQLIDCVEMTNAIVVGGPEDLTVEVAGRLRLMGIGNVVSIQDLAELQAHVTGRAGIVNLLSLSAGLDYPRLTFELYKKIAALMEDGPSFLVAVVSEDGAFGFENPTETGHMAGAVAGATKAFAREFSGCLVRVLDVHPDLNPAQSASMILRSVSESFSLETGVDRNAGLFSIRLFPALESNSGVCAQAGDVILATGGARGITSACLLSLAQQQQFTMVLLGRSALSKRSERLAMFGAKEWEEEKARVVDQIRRQGTSATPVMVERELVRLRSEAEAFQNIRALKAAGSEVIYRALDICDEQSLDAAIQEVAQLCGRVDIVIHGAGVDSSRSLRSKTLEEMEQVLRVKVEGMRNLLAALERHGMTPRRIVGFGSVSGRFGNVGQVDYAAANDALAHLLRWTNRRTDAAASTIDWAPWSDIGMAAKGTVQKTLRDAGIDFIAPDRGAQLLIGELTRPCSVSEVVAAGRLGPFTQDAFQIEAGATRVAPSVGLDTHHCAGQMCRIVEITPGEHIKARVVLDPSHVLLNHHRIDRAAVLPGVGGIEIMRSAVALLNPQAAESAFQDVVFESPLKIFKNEPIEVDVEAIRISDASSESPVYQAQLSSRLRDKRGREVGQPRIHHRCRIVLGGMEQAGQHSSEFWNDSVFIPATEIYSAFFHGPAFKFLDHVALKGSNQAVRFRFTDTECRDSMFADTVPAAIEAAFQAAAAFGMESRGIMTLPVGIEDVRVYAKGGMPSTGELVPVPDASPTVMNGRTAMNFNGLVTDRDGKLVLALRGINMVELDHAQPFPKKVFETMLRIEEVAEDVQTGSRETLTDMFHHEELSDRSPNATPKRAMDWLAGRVALKRAIQKLLAEYDGKILPEKSIRIIQDDMGKPAAELADKRGRAVADVSLSHSNGMVMAAVAHPGAFGGMGIDIEKVEVRSETWVEDYFTDEEIRAAGNDGLRWTHLTRVWCLKEAALKAFGVGLRFDLRDICVAAVDESGRAQLEFRNGAAVYLEENGPQTVEARVEESDDLVIARVMIRKERSNVTPTEHEVMRESLSR